MKDAGGTVVYVGKAKSLRARVSSYFQDGTSDDRAFVGLLSGLLADIETVVTRTEKEALLLERELIRRHEPRFNVIWKDDKQYLCLRIDERHEYPWVQVVRHMGSDGARYFGPFHSASAARQTLRVVNRHFQLRTCRDSVLYSRTRPCLEYQIGRCPAPCVLEIDRAKYAEGVEHVVMFLEGKGEELVARLEQRMYAASERTDYEVAAHYRDQIRAVEKTLEKQKVALPSLLDQDVFGTYREGDDVAVSLLEVRKGRIRNVSVMLFEGTALIDGDLLGSLLLQRYGGVDPADMPVEVLVGVEIPDAGVLAEIASEHKGARVDLKVPRRGDRASLVALALENAEHGFHEKRRQSGALDRILDGLEKKLHLSRRPMRIECYDISNFQGGEIVASRATFVRAAPKKDLYRRYGVKQSGQDDFGAMYEVLSRRFARGRDEDDLPDLVVVDGGRGQLNVARAVFRDLGIEGVDLVSLAKSRFEGDDARSDRSPERVFVENLKDPIVLPQTSPELLLLARIRDEAHRFAVSFHRQRRAKRTIRSELESIPGVGPARRRALLRELGSVERVKAASIEEIARVPGIGPKAAARIWRALHPGSAGDSR
jgi:excinuclease ABC subunit C